MIEIQWIIVYLGSIFRAMFFEIIKLHHFGHYETLLEICVYPPSCLWCFCSFLTWFISQYIETILSGFESETHNAAMTRQLLEYCYISSTFSKIVRISVVLDGDYNKTLQQKPSSTHICELSKLQLQGGGIEYYWLENKVTEKLYYFIVNWVQCLQQIPCLFIIK